MLRNLDKSKFTIPNRTDYSLLEVRQFLNLSLDDVTDFIYSGRLKVKAPVLIKDNQIRKIGMQEEVINLNFGLSRAKFSTSTDRLLTRNKLEIKIQASSNEQTIYCIITTPRGVRLYNSSLNNLKINGTEMFYVRRFNFDETSILEQNFDHMTSSFCEFEFISDDIKLYLRTLTPMKIHEKNLRVTHEDLLLFLNNNEDFTLKRKEITRTLKELREVSKDLRFLLTGSSDKETNLEDRLKRRKLKKHISSRYDQVKRSYGELVIRFLLLSSLLEKKFCGLPFYTDAERQVDCSIDSNEKEKIIEEQQAKIIELEKQLQMQQSTLNDEAILENTKGTRISQAQRDIFTLLVVKNYQDYQTRNALFEAINTEMREYGVITSNIKYPTLDKLIDEDIRLHNLSPFPPKQK